MKLFQRFLVFFAGGYLFFIQDIAAQVPTHLPAGDPEPVPFTLPNIIIFIIIPLGLLIFYVWWLRQRKKKQEELNKLDKEQENNSTI